MAHVSLAAPDAGVAEAERAIKELGALGVQIYTNVAGKPLDRPEYLPFWNKMNQLGAPVWLHPTRGAETPDYISEDRSLYEIWWTFGWSYETACAMARLVFAKIIDTHPNSHGDVQVKGVILGRHPQISSICSVSKGLSPIA